MPTKKTKRKRAVRVKGTVPMRRQKQPPPSPSHVTPHGPTVITDEMVFDGDMPDQGP